MTETRLDVEHNGARLRTLASGPAEAPALLFMHGGAGTLEDFAPLLPYFAGYRCILMDSRGHGGSTLGTAPLDYPTLARDAEAVIQAHRLQRPVLIGHSDGGIAAIHVAAAQRVELGGVVLLAADAFPPPAEILDTIYAEMTADVWRASFPDSVERYQALNPAPDFERFFTALAGMWRQTTPGNYPAELTRQIRCPALVLGGDADQLVPREVTLALGDMIPGASLGLLPYAGHVAYQTQPERIAPYILDFLAQLAPANT